MSDGNSKWQERQCRHRWLSGLPSVARQRIATGPLGGRSGHGTRQGSGDTRENTRHKECSQSPERHVVLPVHLRGRLSWFDAGFLGLVRLSSGANQPHPVLAEGTEDLSRQEEPRSAQPCSWVGLHGVVRKWRGGPRGIWYSDEHEAEAKQAQLHKRPSRFGTWILRHLGYKGEIGTQAPHAQTRRPHERPLHRPPGN